VSENRKKQNIILIGFMGTGKSTVGRKLARTLDWDFVDCDAKVEEREHSSIADMFQNQGEAYFRQAETDTIHDLLIRDHQIVSTGGGSVLREENRSAMLANGTVVALFASAETIIERVKGNEDRPLLQGNAESRVRELMAARHDAYDFADLHVDTDKLSPEEVVQTILKALR